MQKVQSDSNIINQPLKPIYRWLGDKIFLTVSVILGISIIALAVAMAWVLFSEGKEALDEFGVIGFIKGVVWDPGVNLQFGA